MLPVEIIARKRDGQTLTDDEIRWWVDEFTRERLPDYQMAAWAMAVFLRGMNAHETAVLTDAMLGSGTRLPRTDRWATRVDKHSTGGIGDKTSLIVAPLLACCGLEVPMISGRGLGPTGGTLDKLEAISGYRTDLTQFEMVRIVERIGCMITGATEDIAPADRRLYALRDVTATVPSIPLITASIMSKKLAENLDALVLDVKHGSGAFMKSRAEARQLAESLVATGQRMGVRTRALVTDMNQPLGRFAGNAVEVDEAIAVLQGDGPEDLRLLTLRLAAELLLLSRRASSLEEATVQLVREIASGAAYEKFNAMVIAQGGDLHRPRPRAEAYLIRASAAGYVQCIDTERLGWAIIEMGGGRKHLGDQVDHAVGLEMLVRLGDVVESDQPLVRLFCRPPQVKTASWMVAAAVVLGTTPVPAPALVVDALG